VGEVSGYKANAISGTTQNVTVLNYLVGGRYTVPTHARLRLYGQALFGASRESSNYAYVQSANAFAFSLGGGAHLPVGRHLGINLVQADCSTPRCPIPAITGRTICASAAGSPLCWGHANSLL